MEVKTKHKRILLTQFTKSDDQLIIYANALHANRDPNTESRKMGG